MFVSKSKYRQLQGELAMIKLAKSDLAIENDLLLRENHELRTKGMLRLTRGEAECLAECIDDYSYNLITVKSQFKTNQHLKKLTDKGYLKRIKRGEYKLTFVKYD
jgi:predicted transcriptional regulator of viral defense system